MAPSHVTGIRQGVNPFFIASIVGFASFMEVLDISIANVSLRHIAGSLSAGQDESTWVLTSYLVANAIVLPMSGWFSNLFGRRNFYVFSIAAFTVSSLLCGLAPSLGWLIFFRVIQGLGGGALQPVSQSIVADAFPQAQRGIAMAIYGMSVVAAPAIGPTLGGWITDNFSWHWIFLINVPIGTALFFAARALIQDPASFTEARKARFKDSFEIDYIGFGLIAIGLGALQLVLDKGQGEDWFESPLILWTSAVSATALIGAIVWEWRQRHPIVNLHLLRNKNFSFGLVLMFMLGFVLMGSTLLLPLFTQTLLGYTPTRAGEVLSPGGVIIIFLMPLVGFLVTRVDTRMLITFGLMTVSTSMFYMTTLDLDVEFHTLILARMWQTMGIAFLFIPINASAYDGVDPAEGGNASALINLARNIGSSVGISLLTTLITRGAQAHQVHMVDRFSPLDPVYQDTLGDLTAQLGSAAQATGALYAMLQRNAAMLSFEDGFRLLGICILCIVPLPFLMRRPKPGAGPLEAH